MTPRSRTLEDTQVVEMVVREPGQAHEEAELEVIAGRELGRRFPLADEVVLGRGEDVDFETADDRVSRHHARIRRTSPRTWILEDLGSRNHTYVNGQRVASTALHFGDRISLGLATVLRFRRRDTTEAQLLQAQKLQSLGELASGIAHDFNNLLMVILANVTELRGPEKQDAVAEDASLGEIEVAARRAVDLTSQLLAYARSRRCEHHPYDLSGLVHELARMLSRTIHRSIALELAVPPDLTSVGDPSQIHQLLMNLCVNAADAMPSGGTLTIRGAQQEVWDGKAFDPPLAEGRYVVLDVEDTGVGMTEDLLERVFEPFFTTKDPGRGTGLGLSTAASIVQQNGGRIEVSSEVGVGTCFRVYLPGARRKKEDFETTRFVRAAELQGRALLVDDDDLVRRVLARLLNKGGLQVVQAGDGEEAVRFFRDDPQGFDVVVLDLDMPRQGGEQTLTELLALRPDIPVLISSGHNDEERDRRLQSMGARGFVHKPYDAATLLEAVIKAMRSSVRATS